MDECLLLSLDAEHERRLLDEEKRMSVVCGRGRENILIATKSLTRSTGFFCYVVVLDSIFGLLQFLL